VGVPAPYGIVDTETSTNIQRACELIKVARQRACELNIMGFALAAETGVA
jgi:hypothetical protein